MKYYLIKQKSIKLALLNKLLNNKINYIINKYIMYTEDNDDSLPSIEVKDSNGTILNNGDSIHVIKDLKVKNSSMIIKRGTVFKNIKLTDNEEEIECKSMVLKTCFLKKK